MVQTPSFIPLFAATPSVGFHAHTRIGEPIHGQVRTAEKDIMPGVKVSIKGKSKSTTTDVNGNFEIDADENDVLIFSVLGFTTKEVVVNKTGFFNIVVVNQQKDYVNKYNVAC